MTRRLAEKAVVDLRNGSLHIDGEEFPYFITESGIAIDGLGDRNAIPTLSFSVFAKDVEVIPRDDSSK